mmetsp:Transcript_35574/g.54371  ORF Transcript_35574/g.54371 Transcript_35574/m.54371 type:complete len:133 (-) Transcript_35574:1553-1951(-)
MQPFEYKPVSSVEARSLTLVKKNGIKSIENTGEKFLALQLFKCEADWAYAMDMKQAITKQEEVNVKEEASKIGMKNQSQFNNLNHNVLRDKFRLAQHAKRRFRAAFKGCSILRQLAGECLDEFSKLEMEAYA